MRSNIIMKSTSTSKSQSTAGTSGKDTQKNNVLSNVHMYIKNENAEIFIAQYHLYT